MVYHLIRLEELLRDIAYGYTNESSIAGELEKYFDKIKVNFRLVSEYRKKEIPSQYEAMPLPTAIRETVDREKASFVCFARCKLVVFIGP
jgi:hypothetical protein